MLAGRVGRGLLPLLAGALVLPGVAGAAGWTVPTSPGAGDQPAVAADGEGSVGLAFAQPEGQIAGSVRPRGGVFSAAAALSASGDAPRIAANASGRLIAAWSGDDERVEFAAGTTSGGFSQLGAVPGAGDTPGDVSAGIDAAGTQTIAWIVDDGTVRVSSRGPGGAFSAPANISAAGAESPQLFVAAGGGAFVVWLRSTDATSGQITTTTTRVERAQVGTPGVVTLATAEQQIDADEVVSGTVLREPQITAAATGAPTVLWKSQTVDANVPSDDGDDVITDTLVASADGGAPQTLRTTTGDIGASALDEGPDGTAAVVWDEGDDLGSAVHASLRGPGGTFGAEAVVSSGGLLDGVTEPRVAVRTPAQPVLLWLRRSPTSDLDHLEGAVWTGSGFAPAAVPQDDDVLSLTLDADGEGNVVGAWSSGGNVRVAAFDAAAPRFDALTVPAGAEAGVQVPMSATVTDTWSATSAVRWAFGDGGTADGAAVQHAYAQDGVFAVSASARDESGNEAAGPPAGIRIAAGATAPPPPSLVRRDVVAPFVSGLSLAPRCIVAGSGTSVAATFNVSEDARMLYSIRRRQGSKPHSKCPGPVTRKVPGGSESVGQQDGAGTTGTNVATIARAKVGARAVRAAARRGRNRARLAQVVQGLPPGTYQLVVRATDAAGNRSVDMIAKFWVLKPAAPGRARR